jgi:hypothetical protein
MSQKRDITVEKILSPFSKRLVYALSLLLILPAISLAYAAPPHPSGPTISTPTITPFPPGPNDIVTIHVNVTSAAGVQNVTVIFSTDNWKTSNTTVPASYNSTNQHALAHIPPLYTGGTVKYYILAFDNNNNTGINNNNGNYYSYSVAAPAFIFNTSSWITTAIVLTVLGAAVSVGIYAVKYTPRSGSRQN